MLGVGEEGGFERDGWVEHKGSSVTVGLAIFGTGLMCLRHFLFCFLFFFYFFK